jgi:dynactin complex subunit
MARKYDERFDELTGLVTKVVGRVDEMHLEMRDMRKEATEMRSEMLSNAEQASGRFDKLEMAVNAIYHDLVPKTIEIRKDVNRISETQTEQSFKIIELLNRPMT